MERETGLEPATPCLEGVAPSQCPETTLSRWRKVASHARSRAATRKTVGRVTVNEPNQGEVYSFAGISCNALLRSLSRVSARLSRVSHRSRGFSHSSRADSRHDRQMYRTFLSVGSGMREIGQSCVGIGTSVTSVSRVWIGFVRFDNLLLGRLFSSLSEIALSLYDVRCIG